MELIRLLTQKRAAVTERWLQHTLETYPADSQRFLKKQQDRCANPVGQTISREIVTLYDCLLQERGPESLTGPLDKIFKIRAVQDFSPSQAVGFILKLKGIIRGALGSEIRENRLQEELLVLESRIDDLALLGFDVYMGCREKIYELRAGQATTQVSGLLKRSGLICEVPEWKPTKKKV